MTTVSTHPRTRMQAMGLPLQPKHRRVLRELYRAGPRGLPALLLFDTKWLDQLIDNQLVEPFVDPDRTLSDRFRLTWAGRAFEPVYRSREERR